MKTLLSSLLALSVIAGATATAMAAENDNDRSTDNVKQFYQKLDQEKGGN